jgi:5-formyltetrahydrofolate cyclo-ligase
MRCFVELDPASLGPSEVRKAASIKGAFRFGRPVKLKEMRPVELIVAGSVAVNRSGARVGKGGGYSDLEYALARTKGLINPHTPIVTTVHGMQVLDQSIPSFVHDIPIDIIVEPAGVIETKHPLIRPEGIYWHLLTKEKINSIPILRWLQEEL